MFAEELRALMIESGLSAYEIAKRTAEIGDPIDSKSISRFLKCERGLTTSSLNPIMTVLGLTVVKKGAPVPCDPPPNFHELAHALGAQLAIQAIQKMAKLKVEDLTLPIEDPSK